MKQAEEDRYALRKEHPEDPIPSESGMQVGPSERPQSLWHIDPDNPICVGRPSVYSSSSLRAWAA